MSFDQQAERLLDLLYAAPGDAAGWAAFLTAFREFTVSSCVSHNVVDTSSHLYSLNYSANIAPEVGRSYNDYYASLDEWYLGAIGRIRPGDVLNGQAFCSVSKLVKTEFYNDFLKPNDWHHESVAVLEISPATLSVITMMRGSRQPDYTEDELKTVRSFVPHIQRALKLHRRFVDLQTGSDSKSWTLNQLPFGVVLLRYDGTMLAANRAAEKMCNGDGLSLVGNTLSAVGAARHEFQRLLKSSWQSALWPPSPERLIVRRRNGSPLMLTVGRVPASMQNGFERAIAVFIHDPANQQACSGDVLQKLFGLTAAECRLALLLAEGAGIPGASEQLGIAAATARTQLKSIFQKTSTKKQSQLARLIANLTTGLPQ